MSILGDFVEPPEVESRLVSFYRNKTPDNAGRLLSHIMSWDYEKLEDIHDYIQWLFPLPEESMFSGAPLVDENVFNAFHAFNSSTELQCHLKHSLVKMLDFYGFKFADALDGNDLPVIIRSSNFYERCSNWLIRRDHNHLRISRILRSLRVLGLEAEAAAFYKALSDIVYNGHSQVVSSQSAEFWRRAAERPLHWAPHLTESECANDKQWKIGLDFLKEYERFNMARDLQKQHDAKKALEEKKEVEFQATKAHIAAVTAERKRKVSGEVKTVPKKRASISQESKGQNSEPQRSEKEAVVADAREPIRGPQEVVQEEAPPNEPKPFQSQFIRPELFELALSGAGLAEPKVDQPELEDPRPTLVESEFVKPELSELAPAKPKLEDSRPKLDKPAGGRMERKSSERGEQSAIHQIQQYQLMSPRQP
ncbi:putative opioid growth factor receptor conserved region protein [Botrytis fragariae]|uniref:Putative opioid growth factor receptor conserved region protein n=1 Tax=Botrytis fragariae TaxID=1964551 RepID=A0A8H6AQR5_9HELO|nr:putative opioid growth factor receptor conserved region protein [Botrytis fragariae]KAF5871882.1 putative opioid growth factor receptor conserved region protein [Botrytis fragariae]